jgi:chromosome segregation ATPase
MTHQEYERWLVRQKQEASAMQEHQIKQRDAVTLPREVEESEQYRSVIDRQMMELQTQLNFLRSVVETLEHRLHPVLADMPVKSHDQEKLTTSMSPIANAFYDACQKVNRESMNLQSLLERLEV